MPTAVTEQARAEASRELLISLMSVKAWIRDTSRGLYADHPTASLMVLSLLDRHGPSRVSDLAEITRVDSSVVSRQVATLEHEGFVERAPDLTDGRAHQLSLTPAGRRVLEQGRERLVGKVAERLGDWSTGEITDFSDRLQQLLSRLSD